MTYKDCQSCEHYRQNLLPLRHHACEHPSIVPSYVSDFTYYEPLWYSRDPRGHCKPEGIHWEARHSWEHRRLPDILILVFLLLAIVTMVLGFITGDIHWVNASLLFCGGVLSSFAFKIFYPRYKIK